jgi:hypothetical protein
MRIAPDVAVGGVDRPHFDTGRNRLSGQPVTEHRGRYPRHRAAEPFPAAATAHGFAPEPTDEDLVRDVVDQFEQAWNDEDFAALTALFCEDMRNDPDFSRSALREVRDTGGELLLKITSLDVDGKSATATILNHGEEPDDIAFVREDGDWKWCES